MFSSVRTTLGVRFWVYVAGGVVVGILIALVAHLSVASPTYSAYATVRLDIDSTETDDEASYDAYEAVRDIETARDTQEIVAQESDKDSVQLFSYRSEPVGPSAYMRITVESDRSSVPVDAANTIAADLADAYPGLSITQLARTTIDFAPPLPLWLFVGGFLGGILVFAGGLLLRSRSRVE